jgi:hypothetical protein
MTLRLLGSLLMVSWLASSTLAADEPLSRTDLAKIGKAATALVEISNRNATAFCVHATGLFVTNEHVIREAGTAPIKLVLDAGTKTQRVLQAKVIRRDKALDLALLHVEGETKLPALALGSDDDLTELMELVAFGFPFGRALSVDREEYPTISVNVGSVTALRRNRNRELTRIQLDVALNPGNSGGPVLNRQGKVAGVVVSGLPGTGVNMAIPISHVSRFLARPEVLFTPPAISRANQDKPVEFQARAVSLLPTTKPLELELVLGDGVTPLRRQPMKLRDGVYRATAIPFPAATGPAKFRMRVRYPDGSVNGIVEDRGFSVDKQSIKLSEIRRLVPGAKARVELSDGRTVEGKLAELDTVAVQLGKQTLRLDLASAAEVTVDAPGETTTVSCVIVARQEGKQLGLWHAPLHQEGALQARLDAIREGRFRKPPRSAVTVSGLRAISSKGDYIGQGKSYSYNGEDLVVRRTDRGVYLTVEGWMIQFGGPQGQFLQVAEYANAKRYPFSGDAPGIEFIGNGRGGNQMAGKFVVWELETRGNQIVKLAIDFVQHCEGTMPPLYGMIRFNSSYH